MQIALVLESFPLNCFIFFEVILDVILISSIRDQNQYYLKEALMNHINYILLIKSPLFYLIFITKKNHHFYMIRMVFTSYFNLLQVNLKINSNYHFKN